jgi:hypothetical protein
LRWLVLADSGSSSRLAHRRYRFRQVVGVGFLFSSPSASDGWAYAVPCSDCNDCFGMLIRVWPVL